jgi:hypothetical protein
MKKAEEYLKMKRAIDETSEFVVVVVVERNRLFQLIQ